MHELTSFSTVKLSMVREPSSNLIAGQKFVQPQDVIRALITLFRGLDREYFVVLLCDTRSRCTGVEVVAVGSLNGNLVHPREVFKAAILGNCAAIILAHNHPSGDGTPSKEDLALTQKMCKAGRILGIPVLDHIIVGDEKGYSIKEHFDTFFMEDD